MAKVIQMDYPEKIPRRLQSQPVIFMMKVFLCKRRRHQAWIAENWMFLRPKGKGKRMISSFLLLWRRPNLLSLLKEQQNRLRQDLVNILES
jgi:hypothetical protein